MRISKNKRIKTWWGGMNEDNEWILVDESNFDFDSDDDEDEIIQTHHNIKTLLGEFKILC